MRNHEREIFERTYRFLSPNDYLIARLTGSFVTDYMNAHKWYYDEASQAIRQSCWRNWRSRKDAAGSGVSRYLYWECTAGSL